MEVLTAAIADAEISVASKRTEHAALAQEIHRLEQELRLMRELKSVRQGLIRPIADGDTASPVVMGAMGGYDTLTAGVLDILTLNGSPMHIQDLATAVRQRGLRIPGKGANANLIAHIRSCDEIVRPVRGMYAVRHLGFADRRAGTSERTRAPQGTDGRVGRSLVRSAGQEASV
jgi:hypothetical protein